mmetsp:Transcript_23572/g.69995  ORF Transcript_23572/g.69995 Transcript_23572/m.69995 type:complete len:327 (-) Transcript_23572:1233-2213(-)
MRTPYSCNPSLPDRRGGGRGGLRVARGARRRPPAARESGTKSTPPRWGDSGSASEISRRREQSAEGGQGQTARGGVFEAGGGGGGEGHGSAPRARSLVGDAPLLRRRDGLDVAVHCASRVLVRRRLPRAAPRRQLGLREVDLDLERLGVDGDKVPVPHQRDRPPHLRLGRDVPHAEAVRAAREAAVGDECDVVPEAGAHDERGRGEHLLHARPALWPLVPDHDHRPLERLRVLHHRSHHLLLRVEAARRPAEPDPLLARDLPHGALGRQVALENGDVPRRLDRLRDGVDDVLPLRQRRKVGDVLGDGLAGDSHAIAVQQALLQHVL